MSLEENGDNSRAYNNSDDNNIFVDGKDNKEATTTSLHHALAKLAEERQRHKRSNANDKIIGGATLSGNAIGGSLYGSLYRSLKPCYNNG